MRVTSVVHLFAKEFQWLRRSLLVITKILVLDSIDLFMNEKKAKSEIVLLRPYSSAKRAFVCR